MEGLFTLLILYIIFSVFSSLIRKNKSPGIPKQPSTQPSKEAPLPTQKKTENAVKKLQEYFGQPTREDYQTISREKLVEQTPEKTFESMDTELEFVLQSQSQEDFPERSRPKPRRIIPPPLPKKPRHRPTPSAPSLLTFDQRRGYLQGIILSEILGPPVSKRRKKGFKR